MNLVLKMKKRFKIKRDSKFQTMGRVSIPRNTKQQQIRFILIQPFLKIIWLGLWSSFTPRTVGKPDNLIHLIKLPHHHNREPVFPEVLSKNNECVLGVRNLIFPFSDVDYISIMLSLKYDNIFLKSAGKIVPIVLQ
jgi:hypothetical protein